jgi:hypothetical protein
MFDTRIVITIEEQVGNTINKTKDFKPCVMYFI